MDSPKVTVLLPVYNGEKYLAEAIESILDQTFRDFEFIIINDGSTDDSPAILARYQQIDDRIRVYHQENRGLIASLNRGCQLARGDYIARMDQDDISLPERLAREVNYLETHPEIGLLSTWMQLIYEPSKTVKDLHLPTAPGVIGWCLIFDNCVAHPSVMMKRDVVEHLGFYRPEAIYAEDYDLWARASFVTKIANIPEILLQHRVWEGSVSSRHPQEQEQTVISVMRSMILRLLEFDVTREATASLRRIASGPASASLEEVELSASLIQQLYYAYLKTNSVNRMEAREVAHDAGRRLCNVAISARKISPWISLVILLKALRLNSTLLISLPAQVITRGRRAIVEKA